MNAVFTLAKADAADLLLRAILRLGQGQVELVWHKAKEWSSATFAGQRHSIRLESHGQAAIMRARHLMQILPDHEFTLAGHIVADILIKERTETGGETPQLVMEIEALTITDD